MDVRCTYEHVLYYGFMYSIRKSVVDRKQGIHTTPHVPCGKIRRKLMLCTTTTIVQYSVPYSTYVVIRDNKKEEGERGFFSFYCIAAKASK